MDAVVFMGLFTIICFIGNILYSIYTGETNITYKMISKADDPGSFWLAIYINIAFAIALSVSTILYMLKIIT